MACRRKRDPWVDELREVVRTELRAALRMEIADSSAIGMAIRNSQKELHDGFEKLRSDVLAVARSQPATALETPVDEEAPLLIDAAECAALLGISVRTWLRLAGRNRSLMPCVKLGRLARWRRSDIDAFIARAG